MKFFVRTLLFVLALSQAATAAAIPPPESAAELAKSWQGKSVALTARPMGRFMAWTRVNMTLGMLGGGRHGSVAGVEALEPGALVVVAVRRMAMAHELAGELDLVGRVVDEEPGVRRLAEPKLERDSRRNQRDGARE